MSLLFLNCIKLRRVVRYVSHVRCLPICCSRSIISCINLNSDCPSLYLWKAETISSAVYFDSFSYLIVLVGTFRGWIDVVKVGICSLLLILEEMLLVLHHWLWRSLCVFHMWFLLCWGSFLLLVCWMFFIMKGYWILSHDFSPSAEMILVFFFSSFFLHSVLCSSIFICWMVLELLE